MDEAYYTADLHLRHRLVARLRGFGEGEDATDAHDAEIAADWDARVRPNDVVWVLGDLTMRAQEYALAWIAERPGRKHLIAGNHDSCHPMHRGWTKHVRQHLEVFETVQALASVRHEGHIVQLSHFPLPELEGADHTLEPRFVEWRPRESDLWLLHGHTHDKGQRLHDRQIHVGWDAWRQLVSQHEITKLIRETDGQP